MHSRGGKSRMVADQKQAPWRRGRRGARVRERRQGGKSTVRQPGRCAGGGRRSAHRRPRGAAPGVQTNAWQRRRVWRCRWVWQQRGWRATGPVPREWVGGGGGAIVQWVAAGKDTGCGWRQQGRGSTTRMYPAHPLTSSALTSSVQSVTQGITMMEHSALVAGGHVQGPAGAAAVVGSPAGVAAAC